MSSPIISSRPSHPELRGPLVRTAQLDLRGASASFTVREVIPDARVGPGWLVTGLVLSSPGVEPFLLWARSLAAQGVEENESVSFYVGGVDLYGSADFMFPWIPGHRLQSWDDMPGWAAGCASDVGHDLDAAREAAAFLSGMVLAAVSDAWAASLVRRACGMVSPERVGELAREAAVEQVMEG